MSEQKEVTGQFQFDGDTKRYHRFQVEADGDIKGSMFFPKGAPIPERVILNFAKTKAAGG